LANIKINLDAEISDDVIGKLFETLKVPGKESVGEIQIPKAFEFEISDVRGKITARFVNEAVEEKKQ